MCTGNKLSSRGCVNNKVDAYTFLLKHMFNKDNKNNMGITPDLLVFNGVAPETMREIFDLVPEKDMPYTKVAILRSPYGAALYQPDDADSKEDLEKSSLMKELVRNRANTAYLNLTRVHHGMMHDMESHPSPSK